MYGLVTAVQQSKPIPYEIKRSAASDNAKKKKKTQSTTEFQMHLERTVFNKIPVLNLAIMFPVIMLPLTFVSDIFKSETRTGQLFEIAFSP